MRAVRADGKLELKQEFIRRRPERVIGPPVLPAHLAELARPVRHDERSARVFRVRLRRAAGAIEPRAREPSPRELIVARHVEAVRGRTADRLFPAAAYPLTSTDERAVDRSLQRPPVERRVDAEQLREVAALEPARIV